MKSTQQMKIKQIIQKTRPIARKTLLFCTIVIFLAASSSLINAIDENRRVDKMIEDFISRAKTTPSLSREGYDNYLWNYYPVPRALEYEISDERNVFYDEAKREIGMMGDILLNRQSAFRDIPLIYQFISYYFGGHSSLRDREGGLYETTGMNVNFSSFIQALFAPGYDNNVSAAQLQHLNNNYWLDKSGLSKYQPFYRHEILSVRVKGVNEEILDDVLGYIEYQFEHKSLYNFLFWLDMEQKHYCTDLISRAYQAAFEPENEKKYATRLNDDGFITSVNDIILSTETYLTTYMLVDKDNSIVNVYYLEDVY